MYWWILIQKKCLIKIDNVMSIVGMTDVDTQVQLEVMFFRGPDSEVVQYRVDPRQRWSKLLTLRHDPKISLISLEPRGLRIRY